MNYHNITHDDMLNGDGLRVVLWVSGCTHKCPHCQNPQTWDISSGIKFDQEAMNEIIEHLSKDYIHGITFSGGDPLHPLNRKIIGCFIKKIKRLFPKKTIWLYTGFLWEEIKHLDFIPLIDILIDGEFRIDELDANLKWRGSKNQRVINVKTSLKDGVIKDWEK